MKTELFCYQYPHPAVTVDSALFCLDQGILKVLLIKRGNDPFKGFWAFPGGFINPDETVEECGCRELMEETGLTVKNMRQFHTFSTPDRDPRERIITVSLCGLIPKSDVLGSDDASDAAWFPVEELPELAFDHEKMLKIAALAIKRDIYLYLNNYEDYVFPYDRSNLQIIHDLLSSLLTKK